MRIRAKIRHRHEPAAATIENASNGEVLVTFDEPQRAITPGQAAVCYSGDVVLGGGWILLRRRPAVGFTPPHDSKNCTRNAHATKPVLPNEMRRDRSVCEV